MTRGPEIEAMEARARKWDARFIELARHVATWSKDPSTQVGAVIVDDLRRVVSLGYNGFPRGVDDTPERLGDRALKYPLIVHAELNAILNASNPSAEDVTLYVTHDPCAECAKAIIQAGIWRVVVPLLHGGAPMDERWRQSRACALTMFEEAGVDLDLIDVNGDPCPF